MVARGLCVERVHLTLEDTEGASSSWDSWHLLPGVVREEPSTLVAFGGRFPFVFSRVLDGPSPREAPN